MVWENIGENVTEELGSGCVIMKERNMFRGLLQNIQNL
jgi:hypothetical protein